MKPSDSTDVEVVETVDLVNVDIMVEHEAGFVVLTLAADDADEDVSVRLSPAIAVEVSDLLHRQAFEASVTSET